MIKIDNPPLIFVHNKRTAGTSISRWLEKNLDGKRISSKHGKLREPADNNCLTFCVIRNPWDIAVSVYYYRHRKINEREKKIRNGKDRKINLQDLERMKVVQELTFSEWIISTQGRDLPKSQIYRTENIKEILRFENLENDFKVIQKYVNNFVPLDHKNRSAIHDNYKEYYCEKSKFIVENHFKDDIKHFNYKF